ncbi:hypothetical protein E2P81_ATG04099 [Venturia nashicola]|uniref:Malic acid transport protein n=1 Tax=Venturia nashicola TaxID=86259 RepID=A0A4Z1PQT0_9PEZI|nr:hypothetical protein E6O75_ATG04199 [Venturia nashicola]TLD37287.1 hypothetical protein E2P81_ATG04099 [Venturia nashicola]
MATKRKASADLRPPSSQDTMAKHRGRFVNRLKHFTWANYTMPMSTGGLALLLSVQPNSFTGLHTIGKFVYIFDIAIFSVITAAIIFRFCHFPGTLRRSLIHPTESLFFATSLLSLSNIITCIAHYGIPECGPWLVVVYRILFWIYFAISFTSGIAQYFLLFSDPRLKIQDMTPAWDLPVFPFMLCGTVASAGIQYQPVEHAMPMLVAGLVGQGVGFIISILMYAAYIQRMIQYGLPSPAARPGMFIAVGPPSFTVLVLIGMAKNFPIAATYFGPNETTRQTLLLMSTFIGTFLWGLSFWFFAITLLAVLACARELTFHLNWWALIFPNVGFTIATINIGEAFDSQGVQWVASVMSIILVATYLFVGVMHIRALIQRQILWPGKDEDVHVDQRLLKRERQLYRRRSMEENGGMLNRAEEEQAEVSEDLRQLD